MKQHTSPAADGRRRLLRGMFAAPAVMTVCSGSAFAAASNLRCVQNQGASPESSQFPGVSDSQDMWLRVRLVPYQHPTDPTQFRYFHDGKYFNLDTNMLTTEGPPDGWTAVPIDSAPQKWAIVRVDEEGVIQGIGATENLADGGFAITGTCWNSFNPNGLAG